VTDEAAALLARDLRRSIGDFVRAVRQDTGTGWSAQSETLDLLDRFGRMNVADLASRRGVTHQTMRLVVAQLEEAGAVRQDADPADGRSRLVSIVGAGLAALVCERRAREARIEEAIRARLSPVEQDLLRAAVPLLARLAEQR
jgi:DNA-binding MarR family transcriptional regulator